jgi:hypothetical protein
MRRTGRLAATALAVLLAVTATACRAQDRPLDPGALGAMIDSLLPPIAEASGLEVLRPVEHALQPRDAVQAFINDQLEEQREEMRAMERAYKELGLLPDTLDLGELLLALYTEQVVGYYDPRTSRLYVVEGIPARTAAPVIAHELVHALQDQHADLEALVAPTRGNDRQMAAQAAAEGQATLVMMALQVAESTGRTIDPGALPDLAEFLGPALEQEHAAFPVFVAAPRIIRESLLFPYLHGATFVQALHRHRPVGAEPPVPFGDMLPTSTQQVLHPLERFILRRVEPLELRLEEPEHTWAAAYDNTLGQFELSILLEEYLGEGAGPVAHGWRGDRYVLLDGPAGERVLVWYVAWEETAAARRFATRYRQLLERRGDRVWDIQEVSRAEAPVIRVVQAVAGTDLGGVPVPAIRVMEERPDL